MSGTTATGPAHRMKGRTGFLRTTSADNMSPAGGKAAAARCFMTTAGIEASGATNGANRSAMIAKGADQNFSANPTLARMKSRRCPVKISTLTS